MEHLLKFLFFIIFFIFLKHNPKNYDKKKKKYHVYSVINYSSNFRYINSTKEGDLIFFKCEGIIQEQINLSDLVGESLSNLQSYKVFKVCQSCQSLSKFVKVCQSCQSLSKLCKLH